MAMKRILTTISVLLLSVAVFAQRTGIREEVAADWNKVSGLDAVYNFDTPAQTPAPEGYEAVYVGHYGRHGSRYAYTSKAYTYLLDLLRQAEQDKNLTRYGKKLKVRMDELWDKVEYHIGELTPPGMGTAAETGAEDGRELSGCLCRRCGCGRCSLKLGTLHHEYVLLLPLPGSGVPESQDL